MEKEELRQIEARIEELQQQIDKATTPFETEKLQERLAKFVRRSSYYSCRWKH